MKTLSDLQVVMGRMGKAFFFKNGLPSSLSATTDLMATADFAMPLTKAGVNFEPGAPDITREQITEGRTWYTFADKGDDNITMQVPSFATDLNDLFLTKAGSAVSVKGFSGQGYALDPKKVSGAWVFVDRDETIMVALPKTDNYANIVGATGDAMGYYNVAVSTLKDSSDRDIIIFSKTTASGS